MVNNSIPQIKCSYYLSRPNLRQFGSSYFYTDTKPDRPFLMDTFLYPGRLLLATCSPVKLELYYQHMSFLVKKMPRRRLLFMHIAVVLTVVCLLGGAMGVQSLMKGDLSLSTIEQLILLTLAIDYSINSSKSFIHARKQRAKCDTDKR